MSDSEKKLDHRGTDRILLIFGTGLIQFITVRHHTLRQVSMKRPVSDSSEPHVFSN